MDAAMQQAMEVSQVQYEQLFRLDGRRFAVLGAASGIGEHITRQILALGGQVLCVDREQAALEQLAGTLKAPFIAADATDDAQMAEVAREAEKTFGQLDGYVDVIGQMFRTDIAQYTLDDWDRDFKVNLSHAILAARHLAPLVHRGSIVYISSSVAARGGLMAPGYGPNKAALEIWVKQLAAQLGAQGTRANAVAPGLFLSPRVQARGHSERQRELLNGKTALGRLGQPHEIAAAAVFLLSDAAGYITGSTLPVEGGALSADSTGIDQLMA